MKDAAKDKSKKESLERLQNSYEQAKLVGDTVRMKMIENIIKRIKIEPVINKKA